MRFAPSYATAPVAHPTAPAELVRRVLLRFGDHRFVLRIELGPPPPIVLRHARGYFGDVRPPRDSLWAYIAAPKASERRSTRPTPKRAGELMLARWEAELIAGALRDDFCAAGGRPLVGWTVIGFSGSQVSHGVNALGQRFPGASPEAFRARVDAVGKRYGFRVVALRLLRPREPAPLLVVETKRDRKAFVGDVWAIEALLNPSASARGDAWPAVRFEGLFLEARDAEGPFFRVDSVYRGSVARGCWSSDWNVYPCPHF